MRKRLLNTHARVVSEIGDQAKNCSHSASLDRHRRRTPEPGIGELSVTPQCPLSSVLCSLSSEKHLLKSPVVLTLRRPLSQRVATRTLTQPRPLWPGLRAR